MRVPCVASLQTPPASQPAGFTRLTRVALLAIVLCAVTLLSGCPNAQIAGGEDFIEPQILAQEPLSLFDSPDNKETHWYDKLAIILPRTAAQAPDLETQTNQRKATAIAAEKELIEAVGQALEQQVKTGGKFSLLSLSCGKARHGTDIQFSAEVGLTKLYLKRPTIEFKALPLDACVAKLAREIGLQVSQSEKGYSPRVTWSKEKVSAFEAFDGILTQYKFQKKYLDANAKITLRIQDFPNQEDFIKALVTAVSDKSKALNAATAAIYVTPNNEGGAGEKKSSHKN